MLLGLQFKLFKGEIPDDKVSCFCESSKWTVGVDVLTSLLHFPSEGSLFADSFLQGLAGSGLTGLMSCLNRVRSGRASMYKGGARPVDLGTGLTWSTVHILFCGPAWFWLGQHSAGTEVSAAAALTARGRFLLPFGFLFPVDLKNCPSKGDFLSCSWREILSIDGL